jgi:AcrR family transcriptional regulator
MDDIAARASITKRALYHHFRSKDDLMAAALAHSSELAIERLRGFRRPTKWDHPARAIARQHKVAVETWLTDALTAAHVVSPRDHAREVMLLMEDADRSYAKAAARAAKTLVQKA